MNYFLTPLLSALIALVENLFLQKNPLQYFISSLIAVISTNESTEFITGHVIYNPVYTYKFQLKNTTYIFSLTSKSDKMCKIYVSSFINT